MDTTFHLNRSSPVVQRVLRLRQFIEQKETQPATILASPQTHPTHQDYQRQSWQKSDSLLTSEDSMAHGCNG